MVGRLKTETFSPVDAAWLRMDRPTNLMVITGVGMFDRPIDVQRLRDTIARRFLIHDRFRQRVHEPLLTLGLPQWEPDPHFDINSHIHHLALPQPGDDRALQELVGDIMSTPLDHSHPLWHFYAVDGYNGGGALVVRLHHCLADGLALVQILLGMTDPEREPAERERAGTAEEGRAWVRQLMRPVQSSAQDTLHDAESLLHQGWETLIHPTRVLGLAKKGADGAQALGKLLLMLPDRKTLFKGQCGVQKRVAWSLPIPLELVKAVSKCLGGTINDVLMAAVAGGLGRYLEGRGQRAQGIDIRAMVPVNLRQAKDAGKLGNRFGLVILALPVGIADPLERMAVLKKRMDDIKSTPEAVVAFGILGTMGMTPVDVEKIIIDIFAAKVSSVMTNVPGPRQPLYMAGSRMDRMTFWVPTAGSISLGLSILSYNGIVTVGFSTDAGLTPDPGTLVDRFTEEFDAMVAATCGAAEDTLTARPVAVEPQTAAPEGVWQAIPAADIAGIEASRNGSCHSLTREGKPCKNRAVPGYDTCRVHVRQEA